MEREVALVARKLGDYVGEHFERRELLRMVGMTRTAHLWNELTYSDLIWFLDNECCSKVFTCIRLQYEIPTMEDLNNRYGPP